METLFFECRAIVEFLKQNSYNYQKYNELIAAVIMSKLYSAGAGLDDAPIGFALKRRSYDSMTDKPLSLQQIQAIIDQEIENNTPIDIIISHVPIDKMATTKMGSRYAWTYQIKRFMGRPGEDATKKLVDYLNQKIPNKYARINARLLLLYETVSSIDLIRVADSFNSEGFPFSQVQFIGFDFKGKDLVRFGDIWPERNIYEGKLSRFLA